MLVCLIIDYAPDLVNWFDLFQKMVKLTLRLEWLEQVTKGQIYQPGLDINFFIKTYLDDRESNIDVHILAADFSHTFLHKNGEQSKDQMEDHQFFHNSKYIW